MSASDTFDFLIDIVPRVEVAATSPATAASASASAAAAPPSGSATDDADTLAQMQVQDVSMGALVGEL